MRTTARDLGGNSARLSALFVAAILVPGCVLAWFSIQNVSSQRDLAEKRLQEEEQQLAAQLGAALREELVRTAAAFFAGADSSNLDLRKPALPADIRAHVGRAFSLDGGGRLLWPRYADADAAREPAPESARFVALFSNTCEPRCWNTPREHPRVSRWRRTSSREVMTTTPTGPWPCCGI